MRINDLRYNNIDAGDSKLRAVDKYNKTIFDGFTPDEPGIQENTMTAYRINMTSNKPKKSKNKTKNEEHTKVYSYFYLRWKDPSITIPRKFSAYDRRVHSAICELYAQGNEYISITMIYRYMGYRSEPQSKHIKKIRESIMRLALTWLKIDNEAEARQYGYPVIKVKTYVIAIEEIEIESMSKDTNFTCDTILHVLREPPLLELARTRNQVTKLPSKIYDSDISKTIKNIKIEEYLLDIITIKGTNTIQVNYDNMVLNLDLLERDRRNLGVSKVIPYLDYYKKIGFIYGYEEYNDERNKVIGVKVYKKKPRIKENKKSEKHLY